MLAEAYCCSSMDYSLSPEKGAQLTHMTARSCKHNKCTKLRTTADCCSPINAFDEIGNSHPTWNGRHHR